MNNLEFLSARNYIKEKRELENHILFIKSRYSVSLSNKNTNIKKRKISINSLLKTIEDNKTYKKQLVLNNKESISDILKNKISILELSNNNDERKIMYLKEKDILSKSLFHNKMINNPHILNQNNKEKKAKTIDNETFIKVLTNRRNKSNEIIQIASKSTNTINHYHNENYMLLYTNKGEKNNFKKTNSVLNFINNFTNKSLKNMNKIQNNNMKNKYLRYIETNLLKNRANYILNNLSPSRGGKESLRKLYNPSDV